MVKFEAPIIKGGDFMTVRIFKRIRFVWKKLLESKALLSSNILHTIPLNFPKIQTIIVYWVPNIAFSALAFAEMF